MQDYKGHISNLDEIRDKANIEEIVGHFVSLKKTGSGYTGLCPFHNEKSGSFHVTPSRNIYKCFGCGAVGDSIKFVMEHQRKDFTEAIEWIANFYHIDITYEKPLSNHTKESVQQKNELFKINAAAARKYQQQLFPATEKSATTVDEKNPDTWPAPLKYLVDRGLSFDTIIEWQLGAAPDEWRFLTPILIQNGLWDPANKLGLVKRKNDQNYDTFRNRIMIPILDIHGQVVGFGGRDLSDDKKVAKYLNSPDSELYNKSHILFGLHQAAKEIHSREKSCAILVEGYMDVISMHQHGCRNTVATCGTALTDAQARILKKHTGRVIVLRDGDAAGMAAMLKDIDVLSSNGLKVEVMLLSDGKDPDDLAREYKEDGSLWKLISENASDGVLFKAGHLISQAADDADKYSSAIKSIATLLGLISDDVKRDFYIERICKLHKIKPAKLNAQIDSMQEKSTQILEENEVALPAWVKDKDEFFSTGFAARIDGLNTGYYFGSSTQRLTKLTNFVINPLFHIYSKENNKRMIEITNGKTTKILEMPSRAMISVDQFENAIFDEGYFVTDGGFNKGHLKKLLGSWGEEKFPLCYELRTLGWQHEGFFAFSNYAFNGELKKFNDMGMVEIHEKKWLSMSASKAQADVRSEDDIYENDKYLTYKEPSISFSEWSDLMVKVYGKNGWMGIAFAIMTIYRDLVFQVAKIPHLYAYGPVQAGKSEFGDSISNLFFNQMPAFNLNQGTEYAFFSRMSRFRNCPNALNEFDENAIKEEWFRAIKGAHDGEGREKGRGGKEGKTKTQKIECTIILMGQYLSTKDDSSVLSRCIPLAFKEQNERTEEQIQNFRKLKELEKKGISGCLVELLQLREIVKKGYPDTFAKIQRSLLDQFAADGRTVKSRILKNIAAPITIIELLADHLTLPFSKAEFFSYGKKMIEQVSNLVSESNTLSEFWRTAEFLLDRGDIHQDVEFKIEVQKSVKVMQDRENDQEKIFEEPRKLIYIRLGIIHTLFSDVFKRKNNKPAPNMESIRMYMRDQPYWIGTSSGSVFKTQDGKRMNTSSIVLDYDKIGVNLERLIEDTTDDRVPVSIDGVIWGDSVKINSTLKFTVMTVIQKGFPLSTETKYYTCYLHKCDDAGSFEKNTPVKVSGLLSEKRNKDRTFLSIDVENVDFTNVSEMVPQEDLPDLKY